jgi:uncharacterized protein YecT (DUF1311 family)
MSPGKSMSHRFIPALLAVVILYCVTSAQKTGTKISADEIKKFINRDDACDKLDQIVIDHLEYFDFDHDGADEAVVVASTCMTGTAGPDVHSVYTRDAAGAVIEVPLPRVEDPPQGRTLPVFGNPNYGLAVEHGELVAQWMDSSERQHPLTVWFKWDGAKFVVDRMKTEGPFRTSYDCSRTTREMDRAICHAPTVAALDAQLGRLYRERMQLLAPEKKQALQTEQRAWLAQREKQCVIYKWWVDCLKEMYSKRIAALSKQ